MKDSVKRITVSVCAAAMSLMITAGSAMAAATTRPQPDGSGETTQTTINTSAGESGETDVSTATQAPQTNVVDTSNSVTQTTTASNNEQRSYQTKLGGFLWFLLSVVVNFIISCWVGNRFYRLSKRSNQSSAEIRALRKDIEEKFGSTLKDISEPAVEVMNQNENYARTDEGLTMPDRQSRIEINDEEREIFRRWDAQRASSRKSQRSTRSRMDNEDEFEPDYDEYDDEKEERESRSSKRRNAYQPTRRSSGIKFDDEDEYDEYDDEYDEDEERYSSSGRRPAHMNNRREKSTTSKASKAKGKAKDFLSNVFPFDE